MAETTMEPWSFTIVFDEDKAKKNGYEVDTLYDYVGKAALAAGRDFMTARDGRRAEKVLVNGAREKVVEMEGLSREMGEWSLLDEVGDMRGARRELDGHEAPARPLDNQVL